MTNPTETESDLLKLAERIEKAESGSRELDAEIAVAVSTDPKARLWDSRPDMTAEGKFICTGFPDELTGIATADFITTDLTAAVAFCERVLPKPWWAIYKDRFFERYAADVGRVGRSWVSLAATPALAIVAATLKARAEGGE